MSRGGARRSRITEPTTQATREAPELAPLYKRRPGVFIMVLLGTIALVLSTMGGIFVAFA